MRGARIRSSPKKPTTLIAPVASPMPTAPPQGLPGPPVPPGQPPLGSMQKGGRVSKTGNYQLHKGETVVPAAGATDGLGAGSGGLAIHSSAKGANIAGYEPTHSSRRR